jgi:hypothetical protein
MYLKSIRGLEGEISIPSIGASIGTTAKWSLERREDRSEGGNGVYIFTAFFSYMNPYLFDEESLTKEIRVRINKEAKWYRVKQVPGTPVQRDGNHMLRMEEVTLWPIED